MLESTIIKDRMDFREIKNLTATEAQLTVFESKDKMSITKVAFQLGLLTVIAGAGTVADPYQFGIPNEEVREVINDLADKSYVSRNRTELKIKLVDALHSENFYSFLSILQGLILTASYYLTTGADEGTMCHIIGNYFDDGNADFRTEVALGDGRADIVVWLTGRRIRFTFEFKLGKSATIAACQMFTKKYILDDMHEFDLNFGICINLDRITKNID